MDIRGLKRWLMLAVAFLPFGQALAAETVEKERLRVQIVIQGSNETLRAYHFSKGRLAGVALVPFFNIASLGVMNDRGDRLNATVSPYDRGAVLEKAFEVGVTAKYPVLDIDARVDSPNKRTADKELVKQAEAEGFRYLLVFEDEFTGVHTIDAIARNEEVAVLAQGKFQLFDLKSGKSMLKSPVMSYSNDRMPLKSAIEEPAFFTGHYPDVANALAAQVFFELYRVDLLHAMAETVGRGDEVPAFASLLAKYAPPIKIRIDPPKKWKVVDLKTPYARVVEPSGSLRMMMGVRFDVDLLVPELGQKVGSLDEYMAVIAGRLGNMGFDPNTLAPYEGVIQPGLEGYAAYVVKRPNGGGNVYFVKRLDEIYVSLISVVTTENMDFLLEQHKTAIEAAIRGGTISIQSAAN